MDLVDENGEIRCTAFKEQCDKFYDMIEVLSLTNQRGVYIKKKNMCTIIILFVIDWQSLLHLSLYIETGKQAVLDFKERV